MGSCSPRLTLPSSLHHTLEAQTPFSPFKSDLYLELTYSSQATIWICAKLSSHLLGSPLQPWHLPLFIGERREKEKHQCERENTKLARVPLIFACSPTLHPACPKPSRILPAPPGSQRWQQRSGWDQEVFLQGVADQPPPPSVPTFPTQCVGAQQIPTELVFCHSCSCQKPPHFSNLVTQMITQIKAQIFNRGQVTG